MPALKQLRQYAPHLAPMIDEIEAELERFAVAGAMMRDLGVSMDSQREPIYGWDDEIYAGPMVTTWRIR